MRRNWCRQRPSFPRLNRNAPLAKGLVFAGVGGGASTLMMADSSLYGNHGTLTNMDPATDCVWVPELGRFGHYFTATGSEYINLTFGNLPTAAPLTLSCWGYSTTTAATTYLMSLGQAAASGDFFSLRFGGTVGGDPIQASIDGASASASNGAAYAANTLYHVCGVFASNVWRLCYVNGVAGTLDETDLTPSSIALASIGVLRRTAPVGYHTGLLSDPMIWNRALSPAEISALADPSNVMLSGLLLPPARKIWAAVAATTLSTIELPTIALAI